MEPHLLKRINNSAIYGYTNDRQDRNVPPGDVLLAAALAAGISLDEKLGMVRQAHDMEELRAQIADRAGPRVHRTFGLYRLEILAALANAVLLFGVAVYVLVAIVKKRLVLDASLFQILQVLSVTLFEKTPILRAFNDTGSIEEADSIPNQLSLLHL